VVVTPAARQDDIHGAADVKKWLPVIRKEMDYCIQQTTGARSVLPACDAAPQVCATIPTTRSMSSRRAPRRCAASMRGAPVPTPSAPRVDARDAPRRFVARVYELEPDTAAEPGTLHAYTSRRRRRRRDGDGDGDGDGEGADGGGGARLPPEIRLRVPLDPEAPPPPPAPPSAPAPAADAPLAFDAAAMSPLAQLAAYGSDSDGG
jgi:hypothetical protein